MTQSLTLENITAHYGTTKVLEDLSLHIAEGELVSLLGSSGCGKTTTLRLVAGFLEPTSGAIRLGERDLTRLPAHARDIGLVFQTYALFPHLTVRDNVGFGLKQRKISGAERTRRVDEMIERVGLGALADRHPANLSGGQRQRVALARALVIDPPLLMFDEPLSNLDAALRVEMRYEIAKLHQNLAATMIYVTHDQVEAMTLADRIVVLEGGHIAQVGTPRELYETPANLFVAQFIGSPKMNILPCKTEGGQFAPEGGRLAPYDRPRHAVKVGIRPEHIVIGAAGEGAADATVDVLEYLGSDTFVIADGGPLGQITIRAESDVAVKPGDRIGLVLPSEKLHFFDEAGQAV